MGSGVPDSVVPWSSWVLRGDKWAEEYASLFNTKFILRAEPREMNFIKGQKHALKTQQATDRELGEWAEERVIPGVKRRFFFSVEIVSQSCQILREHGYLLEPVSCETLRTLKKWYSEKGGGRRGLKMLGKKHQTTDVEEGRINRLEHSDEVRSAKEYCVHLLICSSVA